MKGVASSSNAWGNNDHSNVRRPLVSDIIQQLVESKISQEKQLGQVFQRAKAKCRNDGKGTTVGNVSLEKKTELGTNNKATDVHTMIDSSCNIINDFYSKVEKLEIDNNTIKTELNTIKSENENLKTEFKQLKNEISRSVWLRKIADLARALNEKYAEKIDFATLSTESASNSSTTSPKQNLVDEMYLFLDLEFRAAIRNATNCTAEELVLQNPKSAHAQISKFYEEHKLNYFQINSLKKERNDESHIFSTKNLERFALDVEAELQKLKNLEEQKNLENQTLTPDEMVYSNLLHAIFDEYQMAAILERIDRISIKFNL